MENEFEDFVRRNREAFDPEMPDPAILHKIKKQLKTPKQARVFILSRWLAAASFFAVVVAALLWSRNVWVEQPSASAADGFDNRRQEVLVALNNSQSATQRLSGALAAARLEKTDKAVVDTLVRVMTTDASSNVRLASLDALSKFYRQKYVREQTMASLPDQDDPVVKSALISLLTQMNETSIAGELLKIVADETVEREIKDQAYRSLFKLKKL